MSWPASSPSKMKTSGERLHFVQNSAGGIFGPHNSWLLMRGMKTLALRMRQHEESARKLSQWLAARKDVQRVYYPGLSTHPGHDIASRQADGYGGMLSFDVGSGDRAERVLSASNTSHWLRRVFGAVESLISVPRA